MKALVLVDIQNDYCEGGAMETKGSNVIFPFINELVKKQEFSKIIAVKDWHPENHSSFAIYLDKKPLD